MTEHIRRALRTKYPQSEYAVFFEVGDAPQRTRSADAIAMTLWSSRGFELTGFEFKVDRRDWLRELKNPAKAESIASYCDRWWVVVDREGIVKPEELPAPWGLMMLKGWEPGAGTSRLYKIVEAKKLEASPINRKFFAAVLRAAQKESPEAQHAAEMAAAVEAARREAKNEERAAQKLIAEQAASYEASRLRDSIAAFEAKSGIKIEAYNGERIGDAVADYLKTRDGLDVSRRAVARSIRELTTALDILKATSPQETP